MVYRGWVDCMAWDDIKVIKQILTAQDWNDMVSFVKSGLGIEIVGVLPLPGTQARVVYLTTDEHLYLDTG